MKLSEHIENIAKVADGQSRLINYLLPAYNLPLDHLPISFSVGIVPSYLRANKPVAKVWKALLFALTEEEGREIFSLVLIGQVKGNPTLEQVQEQLADGVEDWRSVLSRSEVGKVFASIFRAVVLLESYGLDVDKGAL